MKKIIALVLVLVLMLAITGCGNNLKEIKSITDNSINKDLLTVVEVFFVDKHNQYSFDCLISQYIIVEYMDGTTENVREALENGHIQITDLDKYGIEYFTNPK